MTDDEAITVAMLHGCAFAKYEGKRHPNPWYVTEMRAEPRMRHPVEVAKHMATGTHGFPSAPALAHAYCKHFNIGW